MISALMIMCSAMKKVLVTEIMIDFVCTSVGVMTSVEIKCEVMKSVDRQSELIMP